MRSAAESMLGQVFTAVPGLGMAPDGGVAVADPARFDPSAPVAPAIDGPGFDGLRGFLTSVDPASVRCVKWQVVGPVTAALALRRAGLDARTAAVVADRAVRATLRAVDRRIAERLPDAGRVVFIDEPMFTGSGTIDGLPSVDAVSMLSGIVEEIEGFGSAGVHCCADGDCSGLAAARPTVLSIPARSCVEGRERALRTHLERGGWIAWGVVPTDVPDGYTSDSAWSALGAAWRVLERAGCDPQWIRERCLVTPDCGLAGRSPDEAELVLRVLRDVAERVRQRSRDAEL
jgi:methionine synthase II (cobalamin-independent)